MALSQENFPVEITRKYSETSQASLSTGIEDATPSPGKGLEIHWSNGELFFLDSKTLRLHCPCAECRDKAKEGKTDTDKSEKRPSLRVLRADSEQELNLSKVWPIGNYAIGIRWADGHDSGIYTFDLLRTLCTE